MRSQEPAYERKVKTADTDPLVNSYVEKGDIALMETLYGALFRGERSVNIDGASGTWEMSKYPKRIESWDRFRSSLEEGISELVSSGSDNLHGILAAFKSSLLEIEGLDTDQAITSRMAVIRRTAQNIPDEEIKAMMKLPEGVSFGEYKNASSDSYPEAFNKLLDEFANGTSTRQERYTGALYISRLIESILSAE